MTALTLLCSIDVGAAATSEDASPPPQFELALTPSYQGKENLRSGGRLSEHSTGVRASYMSPVSDGGMVGLTLGYDYDDYNISRQTTLGAEPPWKIVRRFGLGTPVLLAGTDSWSYFFSPSVELSEASGARWSKSLEYGGMVAAFKQVDAKRRIGFGLSVTQDLEKVYVYPVVLVDWWLTDRLRIVNPPAGGAIDGSGVELDYRVQAWTLGVGSGYETHRFRLSEHGANPDGIGQHRQNIAYLQARYALSPVMDLDVFAGCAFLGRARVEDSKGHLLNEQKTGAAPLAGITLRARF